MVEVPDKASSGGSFQAKSVQRGAETNEPATGYNVIETPDGGLSAEAPGAGA